MNDVGWAIPALRVHGQAADCGDSLRPDLSIQQGLRTELLPNHGADTDALRSNSPLGLRDRDSPQDPNGVYRIALVARPITFAPVGKEAFDRWSRIA